MTASGSARDARTRRRFLKANPDMTAKIEAAIRQNSGLIAEQILAGSPSATPTAKSRRMPRRRDPPVRVPDAVQRASRCSAEPGPPLGIKFLCLSSGH